MPRIRTSKEFAIKLIHPKFGDFYYSYAGWSDKGYHYIFVRNLSKVSKWKTEKFTEKQINNMLTSTKNKKCKILLSFGENVDDSLKTLMIESKKKFYFPVSSIASLYSLNKTIEDNIIIESNLKTQSISFLGVFEDLKNNFIPNLEEYLSDSTVNQKNVNFENQLSYIDILMKNTSELSHLMKDYISNNKQIHNTKLIVDDNKKNDGAYLDIVDASYNFRSLKIKTLKILDED